MTIYAKIVKNGERLVPAKRWVHDSNTYYKFITGNGTKWFKVNKENISRISYKYISKNEFKEIEIKIQNEDKEICDYLKKY